MNAYQSLINSEYQNLLNEFQILMEFLPQKVSIMTTIINSESSSWNTIINNISTILSNTAPLGDLSTYLQSNINTIQGQGSSDPSLPQLLMPYSFPGSVLVAPNVYMNVNNVLSILESLVPQVESTINNLITDSNLQTVLIQLRQYFRYLNSLDLFNSFYKFSLYETTLVNAGIVTSPVTNTINSTLNINSYGIDFTQLCSGNVNINSSDLENLFYIYKEVISLNWGNFDSFKAEIISNFQ